MDEAFDTTMRPVEPIDFAVGLAAAQLHAGPAFEDIAMIVDPISRRPLGRPVPSDLAAEVTGIFRELTARADWAAARVDEVARRGRGVAYDLRAVVTDAGLVAGDLRALVYLFDKALDDDAPDTQLSAASRIVTDCIRTMAARLDALGDMADAAMQPLRDEQQP